MGTREMPTIGEFSAALGALSDAQDFEGLLTQAVASACRLVRAGAAMLYLLDHMEQRLHLRAVVFDGIPAALDGLPPIPLFKEGKPDTFTLPGYCVFSGKAANIQDVRRQSEFDWAAVGDFGELCGARTGPVLGVPFCCPGGGTIGALLLVNFEGGGRPFSKATEQTALAFASQASMVAENVRLIAENRRLINVLHYANCQLEDENTLLRKRIESRAELPFPEIIGSSTAMGNVFRLMHKVLDTDATVLLQGESGTGKDIVAQAIHNNSKRKAGPFKPQNCAALPDALLESELFGYRRGAFSGAVADKPGLIESAHNGTLFLDEIGDMPLSLQAKLLRVLEDRKVRALGTREDKVVNVRFVAATHRDLQERVKAGLFREDLYYRLSVFPIELPPLREREGDIILLLDYYLKRHAQKHAKDVPGFAPDALDRLLRHNYPGNVRELSNLLERAVLLCEDQGKILHQHLPPSLQKTPVLRPIHAPTYVHGRTLKEQQDTFEAALLREALRAHGGNQTAAARSLAVSRRALIDKINKHSMQPVVIK